MDGWNDRYRRFEEEALNYVKKVRIQDFEHSSYCSLKHKYFYGESPKTACSTIKKVLIQAELGQQIDFEYDMFIHYREFNPFLKITQVGNLDTFFNRKDIFKFCFVRNPYSRLLSCYLDKIKRDQYQNQQIKIQLGYRTDEPVAISFEAFVDAVVEQPIQMMDQHWRVQYYQTFQENIQYDFIGKFENFESDLFFVLDRLGIDKKQYFDTVDAHATKANQLIQNYYSPEIAEKVYQKYKIDFDHFGYKKDLF